MRASEWLAATAFLFFAVVCWFGRVPHVRRLLITGASLLMLCVIAFVATQNRHVRDWAPLTYVLAGYYVSGRLFVEPSARVEAWLLSWDHRLLGDPTKRFSHWPPLALAYLDLVYTFCFLLLPAGYAALAVAGRTDLSDRYWTIVVASEFGAFMPLAFIQTRPPWVVERKSEAPDGAIHRLASLAVRRASIGVNTFPSGHAAGSFGLALAVVGPLPWTGLLLLILAGSIAIACVVGRYHYLMDVVVGIGLAFSVWAVTWAVGI